MCGRYKQEYPDHELTKHFKLKTIRPTKPRKPRYNIAPGQDVLAIRVNPESHDPRQAKMAFWRK